MASGAGAGVLSAASPPAEKAAALQDFFSEVGSRSTLSELERRVSGTPHHHIEAADTQKKTRKPFTFSDTQIHQGDKCYS